MPVAVVTGSAGLIGSATVQHFTQTHHVAGIDNDMRRRFFGSTASTAHTVTRLQNDHGDRYLHHQLDIRDRTSIDNVFASFGTDVDIVIHTAAQPSHDWAAREPLTDFDINAVGTINLLEATRRHAPNATFIFTSTNKVYGDTPNRLPVERHDTRYELPTDHTYHPGIREDMPIDASMHSIFGASKVAADVMVQEYGHYYEMSTVVFRGGTLTGPNHSAAELHGFLAYLMRCTMTGAPYTVFGHHGLQVRDAIHADDLVACFAHVHANPPAGARVYNIGGGRHANCSVIEAIRLCEDITGRRLNVSHDPTPRRGDHVWWVTDNSRFENDYPDWKLTYDIAGILNDIHETNRDRWR